jgi:hypothetical protein
MNTGIISLHLLYEFLESNLHEVGFKVKSPTGRRYSAVAARVCETVAKAQGFYLWGRYNQNGLWRNIYLGKAGFGKTAHLRARLLEELKDESACLWRAFVSVAMLEEAGERNSSPRMWPLYRTHMSRALRKAGATHRVGG